ncbi:UNVERIFIED_ORG: hypothetical protein ABRZ91_003731 [Heyndrickxia coagulans]
MRLLFYGPPPNVLYLRDFRREKADALLQPDCRTETAYEMWYV